MLMAVKTDFNITGAKGVDHPVCILQWLWLPHVQAVKEVVEIITLLSFVSIATVAKLCLGYINFLPIHQVVWSSVYMPSTKCPFQKLSCINVYTNNSIPIAIPIGGGGSGMTIVLLCLWMVVHPVTSRTLWSLISVKALLFPDPTEVEWTPHWRQDKRHCSYSDNCTPTCATYYILYTFL